jgi:hypothetical protein
VAAKLARNAVCLDVEYDDYAVVLEPNQRKSHVMVQHSRTRPDASRSPRWLKRIDVEWPLPMRCESLQYVVK